MNPNSKYIPGPGNYGDSFSNVIKSAPKYGFGSSERNDSLEKLHKFLPGPGAYD